MKDLEKKRIDRMKELEDVDCAGMLKTAGVKIKVMNQLLDRLIPSDDSHTVITENKTYGIEVIPGNLMTFRVPVKNAYPPMRFNITYNDSEKNAKAKGGRQNKSLKVFVDQEEKEPKEGRCKDMYYAPDKFFVHPTTKGSPVFDSQNIYVSFESHVGISISVRVRSTDPKGHRKKKEERVYVDMEYEDDDVRNPFYDLLKKMEK